MFVNHEWIFLLYCEHEWLLDWIACWVFMNMWTWMDIIECVNVKLYWLVHPQPPLKNKIFAVTCMWVGRHCRECKKKCQPPPPPKPSIITKAATPCYYESLDAFISWTMNGVFTLLWTWMALFLAAFVSWTMHGGFLRFVKVNGSFF